MPNYTQPIVEGDEMDPEVDLNMDPNGFNNDDDMNIDDDFMNEQEDDEDDDLNLFDSLEDNIEEDGKDPYTIVIRYPNEEYKVTIFCPKSSEYGLNDQESKIFLRNAELLQENQEMTTFYKYLSDLGI